MSEALEIERKVVGEVLCLTLKGNITEDSHIEAVATDLKPLVIIDTAGIQRINSYGIRQWVNVMKQVAGSVTQLIFHRCPPAFVEQLNMISNFGGGGIVYSFYLPYYSEAESTERLMLYELPAGKSPAEAPSPEEVAAGQGASGFAFNDVEDEYFYFLQLQKGQEVQPEALAVLKTLPKS